MNKLLRLKSSLEIKNQSNKSLKLNIYGYIGYWDTSAERILRQIEDSKAEKIHVHINSGGGSAFDGIAISNILKNHKAEVIVHVDGWAASAASIICMGADKVIMPSNTMMMVHQASTYGYGNADDFEKVAKDLRKIDKAVTASYKHRFVGEEDELTKLLKDETWLTADEAVSLGFADEISDEIDFEEPIESEEDEPENIKEDLVAKYSKKQQQNKPEQEPQQSAAAQRRGFFF